MKKILLPLALLAILLSCNSGDSKDDKKEEEKTVPETVDLSKNPDYQKGLEIAAKSDCFTCHKVDESQPTGPAWREVANKYAGSDTAVSYLAKKIIAGGSGVWGTVPMAAHSTFSQEDAEAVAKYVLLLKK